MTWFADQRLAALAEERPDEPALLAGDRVLRWWALDARATAVAARVQAAGVEPGQRVAISGAPVLDSVAALLGVLRAGAVATPVPAGLTSREVSAALDVLDPALVLLDGDVYPEGGWTFTPGDESARDPEAPAAVVLTSGTTASPKGVVLSARALAASADAWLAVLRPVTGWAMPLGLGHVAGLGIVWRAILDAVPVRLLPPALPGALLAALRGPDPRDRTHASAEVVPSHVSLVPGQLVRLLDAAGDTPPPATLRAVLLGGGMIPPALVERAIRAGWPVVPTYGLSEMGSGVTALLAEEAAAAPGTAGRPLPGVSLRIEEPDRDGIGEIVVAGPARSSGYLGETPKAADAPLHTGDLGRLDAEGRLVVVDRRTDRIVRGGENISPAEVEAVLASHPAVADIAVVGRPDETWGAVPLAAVVLAPDAADPGDDALAAHARASLAGFKVPAAFTRLEHLPRTSGGKLRRDAVRALLAGEPAGELARPGGDAIGWRVTGTGPMPVILLHGTLSTAAQLDRLAAVIAAPDDVTVHALDRRGSGSSRFADPRPLDIGAHVADVIAYLDARRIHRAAIVGVSFGGVLAIEIAARHPDRISHVVAYEPPYGAVADPETHAWFVRLAADTADAHRTGGPAAAAETFLRAVAGPASWNSLPGRARAFLEREGDGALTDAGLRGLDPDGLARIEAPVAILTGGASDAFYARIADALAARIPRAQRETLPGLAHPSPITEPAPVAAAVRAFLERNS